MLLQKNLSRKISPEKSLDFWSQKSVLRLALVQSVEKIDPATGVTARDQLSRAKNSLDFQKSSNLLIWIESCWLPTREGNYCQNVFFSWKRRNTPRFRTLLFGKEVVKTFFYKCFNSGKMNPLHSQLVGTKL